MTKRHEYDIFEQKRGQIERMGRVKRHLGGSTPPTADELAAIPGLESGDRSTRLFAEEQLRIRRRMELKRVPFRTF